MHEYVYGNRLNVIAQEPGVAENDASSSRTKSQYI